MSDEPTVPSAPAAPHTLLLVDDHAIVRQGLAALLANDPDWRVAAEAGTYEDALAAALSDPPPDGVVLDLSLRDRSGLDWIREARRAGYAGKILVLSMHDETLYASKAIDAGAQGYVMKDQAEDTLLTALHTVFSGHNHLSPAAAALLATGDGADAPAEKPATGIASLTAPKQTFWPTQHTSHSSGGIGLSSTWWKSSLLISNMARTGRRCFCKSNVIINTFQVLTLMEKSFK